MDQEKIRRSLSQSTVLADLDPNALQVPDLHEGHRSLRRGPPGRPRRNGAEFWAKYGPAKN